MGECHFYQHGSRIRTWYSPEELDPIILQEPNRNGISVFGAVRIDDGRLITMITEKYNAITFLEFLSMVHARFPKSILILDNAKYHHANIIRPEFGHGSMVHYANIYYADYMQLYE